MGKLWNKMLDICCCGAKLGRDNDTYLQPLNVLQPRSTTTVDELVEQSIQARERLWKKLGMLDPIVLGQTSSASVVGGPKWPALRQAFRVIRRSSGTVILSSDGLSDPFDDIAEGEGNVNGFRLEFYIETPEDEIGESMQDIKSSWQFQLLYTVSQLAAGHGGIRNIIDDMHLLSTEAEGVNDALPDEYKEILVNKHGRVGALLGMLDTAEDERQRIPDKIDGMPLTDVRLVNLKLLSLPELKLITDRGAEGRKRLNELLSGDERLISSLKRTSVV